MSSKPSRGFGVLKDDHAIADLKPGNTVGTGVAYKRQFGNLVPFFEEYDVMIGSGYNSIEWAKLDHTERADAVAYHRLKRLIGLHENDAVNRYSERQHKRKR